MFSFFNYSFTIEFIYFFFYLRTIANAARPDRLAGEILFDEWGTSGRQRPTVSHLLQLLVKAELFRAADYVAVNLLNGIKSNQILVSKKMQ